MNIFSGARRLAVVIGLIWVIGWLVAAIQHETLVPARYDFFVGENYPKFSSFTNVSCPKEKSNKLKLYLETSPYQTLEIHLCVFGSTKNIPDGLILEDPTLLLKDPHYINSPIDIKKKLFNTHVSQNHNYLSANSATRKAIHERFGISDEKKSENEKMERLFDPDAYLAAAEKFGPWTKYQNQTINPFDIFDEEQIRSKFKIRNEDHDLLNDKWRELRIKEYSAGFALMLSGLASFWVLTWTVGWIARGFLGIPRGMDSRP